MRIGINASFLRKQSSGVGQVSINFLQKLMQFPTCLPAGRFPNHEELKFILYLEEDINLKLPDNFKKKVFLPKYKRDDLIRKIWWERFLLPKMAKKDGCDVLFSLYQCPTVLRGKDVKHVMLVHDIIPKFFPGYLNNWRKKFYQKLTERAIGKADKIIAVSHRTEKDLVQHLGIDPKKITVSHIDVDEIYKKEITDAENKRVLEKYKLEKGYIYTGGGLEVRKNTESVLRAYKILLDKYGKTINLPRLVVSGKMMPQLAPLVTDVEQLVEGLGLKERVSLLDHVPQEDLPAIYQNAIMFVYPSHYEGFGLPVLEAMNIGTPVITAKTSSLPEVGGDSVLYCHPGDVDDLAMVMKNLIVNDHLQEELSKRGKARAAHFSWEKFVGKFLNIAGEL